MSVAKGSHWADMARGSLAAIVLASSGLASDRAGADIIKREDLLRGITMTRAQCAAIQQAVWLNVFGRDFCVRYYLSTAGGEGSRPVVFLNGDANGPVNSTLDSSGNIIHFAWADPSRAQDENTDDFMHMADDFSKMVKTTAIYIGRIGEGGTSGNHLSRKTLLELQLMNAALDALRQRYGFEGFHLAGESGGARLVFGLAAMRHDIGCVVSGSGQLVVTEKGRSKLGDPGETYFDVMANVPSLAHNPAERLIIVTDPADQQVPAAVEQTPVLNRLRQAGRAVPQFIVQSTDANHHGVFEYVELVMAGCVLGKRDSDIAHAVSTIIRRNGEINQSRQDKAKFKAASGATAR
jgi:pimeloyl-ACP methyl ester carboxylesterase